MINGGLCEKDGVSFQAILLHELIHAIHARVQQAQHKIQNNYKSKGDRNKRLATPTEQQIERVASDFHSHAKALLQAIEHIDPNWGVEKGYTKEYWLSDTEMVPHLATVWLAVNKKVETELLFGPAAPLYTMHTNHETLKSHFTACFDDLDAMKKIPNDGLHDEVTGLSRIPINYDSILHEAVGQGRWPLVQTK